MKEKEIWKDIEGYEGSYRISNKGRVRSLDRIVGCNGGSRFVRGKLYCLAFNQERYCNVFLRMGGVGTTFQVHRLVAKAFIPNPENKPFVNHIDCNPSNNSVENLEWCTPSENSVHASVLGRLTNPNASRKLAAIKDGQITKIYNSTSEVKKDGFDRRAIYQCIKGQQRRKAHKGFEWKFID